MITKLKRVYSFADIIFGGYRNNTNMGAERYKSICRICEEKCSSMNDRCDKCQLEN